MRDLPQWIFRIQVHCTTFVTTRQGLYCTVSAVTYTITVQSHILARLVLLRGRIEPLVEAQSLVYRSQTLGEN